ncbi:MAG: hypothetical protein Q3M24_06240 [Candidatus Electrothrix aestuarii]|uniref:Uncharacterized protein n=1 Tax=Candidatus Electrothrix aestuarii TaxID=3062594 RepID=A0AAU8LZG7_9BACT
MRKQEIVDWQEINEGIVCNYRDGGDYVLLRDPPENPQSWLDHFKHTDSRRWRFINALRWWAKQKHISLSISANGNAWYEHGDISGEIDLGRELTMLLEQYDVLEAYDEFRKSNWLEIKKEEFSNILQLGPFVEGQVALETEAEPEPHMLGAAVSTAFSTMVLMDEEDFTQAIEDKNFEDIPEKYPELILRSKMVECFGEKFSIDICKKDFCIEFDIGSSYSIKYRKLKKRLSRQSVDAVFRQICADYEIANQQRSESRRILFAHMASLGYIVDEGDEGYAFGRIRREYFFDPAKHLTGNDVRSDLISWLREQDLPDKISLDASTPIKKRPLPNQSPQSIPMLEVYDFSAIDTKAKIILENYWCKGHETLHRLWASPRWYQSEKDSWLDEKWWYEQAKMHNDHLLLAVLGDEQARMCIIRDMKELADSGWSGSFSIYEGYSPLYAFMARDYVWPDENPVEFYRGHDAASPERNHWLRFFNPLPYEIKRYAQGVIRDAIAADHDEEGFERLELSLRVFKTDEIGEFLSPDELNQIHKFCSEIAIMHFSEYCTEDAFLRIAYKFGWIDIVEKLSHNESFWQLWATWPFNFIYSGDFALTLSLFDKDELTQRLSAWVLSMDEKSLPREIVETFNITGPESIMKEQQLPAALAWSRTRLLF